MNKKKFQALYKNTKKEEIIKELYFKCKANYELENIIKEVREEMGNAKHISIDDSKAIIKHEKRILEILKSGDNK